MKKSTNRNEQGTEERTQEKGVIVEILPYLPTVFVGLTATIIYWTL